MSEHAKILIVQSGHVESVWATPATDDHYTIHNIPFEIYNLSLGDTIIATAHDDALHFQQLYAKSGNRTLQVRLSHGVESPGGARAIEILKAVGATYEAYADHVLAVNVPAAADLDEVRMDLEDIADQGVAFQTLDPNPHVDVPVAEGSPAQAQRERAQDDARQWLEDFVNSDGKKV